MILIGTLIALFLESGTLLIQERPYIFCSAFFLCTSESIKLLFEY